MTSRRPGLTAGLRMITGPAPATGMSVEQPLWRTLTAFRLLTLAYALFRYAEASEDYRHPLGGWAYLGVLTLWSLATLPRLTTSERCTRWFLATDLGVALAGILLTMVVDSPGRISAGRATLPTIWVASSVLAFAIKGGWRWGAFASAVVGVANVTERGEFTERNVHNIVLLFVASTAIGYMIELARTSERTLARALSIEAATRERERLARDIHDSVLQVLAMVQRRGTEMGGEAEELGRMAGEQEVALRALISGTSGGGSAGGGGGTRASGGPTVPGVSGRSGGYGGLGKAAVAAGVLPAQASAGTALGAGAPGATRPSDDDQSDLRALLTPLSGPRVTLSTPGTAVPLDTYAAREVAAAVAAALDNVGRHAGEGANAWILVEDEGDEVLVSVRDDGPGFPPQRLADAEREGRLGVAQSIRGRLRDLGGGAEFVSIPGQGAEVEMRVPRGRRRATPR